MRRIIVTILAVVTGVVAAAVLAPSAAGSSAGVTAAAPYCGIRWGSLPESATDVTDGVLRDVRAGRHTCFDRVVVDFAGTVEGYDVAYVDTVQQDGSGLPVPVRGGARLAVVVDAPAVTGSGRSTYPVGSATELVDVAGWRTLRQLAWGGSFEGRSTIAVGVRARLPFRVFTLDGPGTGSRIVIDIAHRW